MQEKKFPIAETFYSLKGEGWYTGKPAFFIRLAGCNLNCEWCDTDHNVTREATIDQLVAEAKQYPARCVVVTGGEPTLHDTFMFIVELHREGFRAHLETNGTRPTHTLWDWIAISPKCPASILDKSTMYQAGEVKFLCGTPEWELYIQEVQSKFLLSDKKKWLMPLANKYKLIDSNIKLAIDYCLHHPEFNLCMQMHKCVGIK